MGSGAIVGALIGVGGSIYGANQQKKAIDEAERKQLQAEQDAEDERKRIFEATKPQEASATVEFGTGEIGGGMTFDDFLTPSPVKEQSTLGGLGSLTFGG